MKKEENIIDEKVVKDLLSFSKLEASENLKYRIMQQISMESVLDYKSRKEKRLTEQLKSVLGVAGLTYSLILVISLIVYLYKGTDSLLSKEYLLGMFSIVIISFILGSILYFDSYMREKLSGGKQNKKAGNG